MNQTTLVILGLAAAGGVAWYFSNRAASPASRLAQLRAMVSRSEGLSYDEYQEYQRLLATTKK